MKVFAVLAVTIGSILIITQARQIPPVSDCSAPCIDGVFVFDVSRSIENNVGNDTEGAFNLMKDFMKRTFDFVNISPTCSRAGLIVFANDSRIKFNLNNYTNREDLERALDDITLERIRDFPGFGSSGTNTPGVLQLMLDAAKDGRLALKDGERAQIAIVITDGRPSLRNTNNEDEKTREASVRLHSSGIYERIYAIGVQGRQSRTIRNQTLQNIAGNISESTFLLRNFSQSQFNLALEDIEAEFSNNRCMLVQCPFGSRCRVCNETCETYCKYSCDIDNGGCDEDSQCVEVDVPTCRSGQCCSPVNVMCRRCTVEGQVYSEQAPALEYQPTCNKPNRTYCPTTAVRSGCVCPNGTVIDEIQNKCVSLSECTCPPQCSHDYCSSALVKSSYTKIPCMRGFPPYTEADCANDCKRTYCHLCDYYYRSPTDDPVYMCRF